MGNTDKNKSKKYRRKIKIRLKDPNIPDSYVCEIFDSSLENEEDESKTNGLEEQEDPSKPKNYFELLMSRECRKNHVNNSIKLSVRHSIKIVDGEESVEKRKGASGKIRKSKPEPVDCDALECETDSSDDESLLQIQKNIKQQDFEEEKQSDRICAGAEVTIEEELSSDSDIITVCESPNVILDHKKGMGILNYFSKTDTCLKNRVNCDTLEEKTVKNSLKNKKTSNCLKLVKKQDSEKSVPSGKKVLLNGVNKENVKLAPLFYKKAPKVIDVAKEKARRDFLYKESSSKKKSGNKSCEIVSTFPPIQHVQQRNDNTYWSQREVCLPLPEVQSSQEHTFRNDKTFSVEIEDFNSKNNSEINYQVSTDKDMLCKLKCKYSELKLDFVIDGLKEKRDKFLARAQKFEKSKNSTNQGKNSEICAEELNALWTDKYKPKSNEILGNDGVVKKLKKWLESWKSFDEELKKLVKSSRSLKNNLGSDEDSDDDFLGSCGENYELKAPCNVCIISGPNGCGKTALVHALAGELEFGVVELNASSKRAGKKVLADIQEATQSHKVQRVNLQPVFTIQKTVKKKKVQHRRTKNKKIEKQSAVLDQANDYKISLILIEDADIVYDEHDEGFFSAIASLVQTSKRPFIFLTNDPNCQNLYNFKTEQCLIFEMEIPNFYSSCAILNVVSALEGGSSDGEYLENLVRQNNYDLRRSLLQLQFWVHPGKTPETRFDLGHLWWGLSKFLFKQDIRHYVKSNGRKRKRVNDLFDSSDDELETATKKLKSDAVASKSSLPLSAYDVPKNSNPSIISYFRVLDMMAILDGFRLPGSQEPIPETRCKLKDSLSLEENMEEASWRGRKLAEEISEELINLSTRIFLRELKEKNADSRKLDFVPPCWEEIRWRNSQEKASEELSQLVPLQRGRDNKSLHLDYLPLLRKMCRLERNRLEMNSKRKNRFYHYLNNLGAELTDKNLEINCDVFERP